MCIRDRGVSRPLRNVVLAGYVFNALVIRYGTSVLSEALFTFLIVLGVTLLVGFIPVHVRLWSFFPFWYHLVFLVTLVPLVVLGSRLPHMRSVPGVRARP